MKKLMRGSACRCAHAVKSLERQHDDFLESLDFIVEENIRYATKVLRSMDGTLSEIGDHCGIGVGVEKRKIPQIIPTIAERWYDAEKEVKDLYKSVVSKIDRCAGITK